MTNPDSLAEVFDREEVESDDMLGAGLSAYEKFTGACPKIPKTRGGNTSAVANNATIIRRALWRESAFRQSHSAR